MCDLFEPRLRNLVDLLTDADHDVRRGDQLMETGRGERRDFSQGFGRDQLRSQFSGDRDRDFDRF